MREYHINPNHMFSDELYFLSNMYPCPVTMNLFDKDYTFQTSEAAFQAGKCVLEADVEKLAAMVKGQQAKGYGRKVRMKPDWDCKKIDWMYQVVKAKFTQNPDLMEQLVETYPLELVETNTWKDKFWGVYYGQGENNLGKILTCIRSEEMGKREQKGE